MAIHSTVHNPVGIQLTLRILGWFALTTCGLCAEIDAQSVCLPAPRLLTTFPMGGQIGTEFEVTVTGQYTELTSDLRFSHPGVTATPVKDSQGNPLSGRYTVRVASNAAPGLVEASLMTRLGLSASRIFTIGSLTEVNQDKGNLSVEDAMPLQLDTVCNCTMTARSIDHYRFAAEQGQRILVDCAAKGIDSKLNPVVVVADGDGQDLVVERRGGAIEFRVPSSGSYIVKVHDLTFKGGEHYFYRLNLRVLPDQAIAKRHFRTSQVSSFSWPPQGVADHALLKEVEPNGVDSPQRIELPCDIEGAFAKAADTDVFEFQGKKGDAWWIEIASERLGCPTDPTVVVQRVSSDNGQVVLQDVAELNDIPSPVKVSSNGYAYDGPPYNAGSSDVLGKFEIKEDGLHRVRLSDLFGGTRNDPSNVYRLIIRKAEPDFALVAWGLHMPLRNGDRNALSKPIALRGGATMALEVVSIRRDGFDGEIHLSMDNLPDGVTATGLSIPPNQNRGIVLITAHENAPRGMTVAEIWGSASVQGKEIKRECHLASMAWPVPNHWSEVPSPRLVADVLVSVGGDETTPITISPRQVKVWEGTEGEKISIPLVHMRRGEFSGAVMAAKTLGAGFEKFQFELPLDKDSSEAVLDLAALKTPPGDYRIAFYGGAVAKYQHYPAGVDLASANVNRLNAVHVELKSKAENIQKMLQAASEEAKGMLNAELQKVNEEQKRIAGEIKAAAIQLKNATTAATAKDIVDIVVSEPVTIRVHPRKEQ